MDDGTFKTLVAILRLAVPYTGIIMSTRETAEIRRETFALGVSQISAGSRTNPGGYAEHAQDPHSGSQFSLGDHRSLDEVIADCLEMGYLPSFCTACYRRGRTGADFMDLAKPGLIKEFCQPNAILTVKEYLEDYASPEAREAIGDLQQIARAELTVPPGEGAASEEDEQAYAEIVEYVRVVAMTMREEYRGPEEDEPIH